MKLLGSALFILLLAGNVYAFVENPPPDEDTQTYNWMQRAKNQINLPQVPATATDPNVAADRRDWKAQMLPIVHYTANNKQWFMIQSATQSSVWYGVELQRISNDLK